eukprot:tig00001339_g8287.t1
MQRAGGSLFASAARCHVQRGVRRLVGVSAVDAHEAPAPPPGTLDSVAAGCSRPEAVLARAGPRNESAPTSAAAPTRKNLIGMPRSVMKEEFAKIGLESFRHQQVFSWINHHGVSDFAGMKNINRQLKEKLAEHFEISAGAVKDDRTSAECGTRKWLVSFGGVAAETVYIPQEAEEGGLARGTLCVSSQAGCSLSCRFCHTGTQRLERNLHASEIVGQVILARRALGDFAERRGPTKKALTHVVFMGQGEPLYNYRNVKAAIQTLMDPEGLSISRHKITVSTAGVAPLIETLGRELGVQLAVSLHAPRDDLRSELMGINKTYPLKELLEAVVRYPELSWARRVTFEYAMLRGVNDSPADARELARLLKHIPSLVNLIPFNNWENSGLECSSKETIIKFAALLNDLNQYATVRWPRGRDIMAACGQLKSAHARPHGSPAPIPAA